MYYVAEKSCIVSYYRQFSQINKIIIIDSYFIGMAFHHLGQSKHTYINIVTVKPMEFPNLEGPGMDASYFIF